ncbi:MAG TPA: hypothetical protein VJK51_02015 [Candidatus Nanoarchaeia archaeon]|nr:hypothetical protein [Candidatus Nanoarchaeia archaeon]
MEKSVEKKIQMAVISGASHALKFKNANWKATDDEIIRMVSREMDEILKKIDNEE